ncbi:MAG TPA: DUF6289 family protein [Thermoanaerobaculia bacterium]
MTRQIRVWVLLGLLILGGTSLLALPPNEVTWEYYSDNTYTNLVGEKILFCSGQRWSWGVQTAYYYVWSYPC